MFAIVGFVKTLPSKVTSAAGNTFKAITDKAAAVVGSYSSGGGGVKGYLFTIVNFVTTLPGKVTSAAGNTFRAISDKAAAIVGSYSSGGGGVKGHLWTIVSFVKGLPSKISSAASGMWNGITAAFRSAVNSVIGMWNNLSLTLGGGSIKVLGKTISVPSITLSTPNIPYLASGGITTGPMLAMIGDNPGGREAVIPLDKYDIGGSTTININVTAPVGSSAAEIGRALQKYLDAYVRAGGRRVSS
jgi:hypothetical protein